MACAHKTLVIGTEWQNVTREEQEERGREKLSSTMSPARVFVAFQGQLSSIITDETYKAPQWLFPLAMLFFPWKQKPIQNNTIHLDKYWWSRRHINKSIGFYPHAKSMDLKKTKKKTRLSLKHLCHDFVSGPAQWDWRSTAQTGALMSDRTKGLTLYYNTNRMCWSQSKWHKRLSSTLVYVCVFTQQVCNRLKRSQLKRSLVRSLDWSWRQLQPRRLPQHTPGRARRAEWGDRMVSALCAGAEREHYSF